MAIVIVKQPSNVVARVGDEISFTVTTIGKNLTYRWEWRDSPAKDWANSTLYGANTPTLSVTAEARRNGYTYRCVITDSNGNSVISDVATLTIVLIEITKQPMSQVAVGGDTVTFAVEATGVASYQWECTSNAGKSWNALTWDGATAATMTHLMNVTTVTYAYRCKLTDANGNSVYTNRVRFYSEASARGLLDYATIKDIADAIREKTHKSDTMLPSEMANIIRSIAIAIDAPDVITECAVDFATATEYKKISVPCDFASKPTHVAILDVDVSGRNIVKNIVGSATGGMHHVYTSEWTDEYSYYDHTTTLADGVFTLDLTIDHGASMAMTGTYMVVLWR